MEERIVVTGGRPLNGNVKIPAAKNSVLPLFAASLLCTGEVRLQAVPRLADVEHCMALLRGVGCAARWEGSDAVLSGPPANSTLPGQTAGQMRASILFCAPLLARLGRAETSLPGGCRIGARPIDLHLAGLAKMGAVELEAGEGRLVLTAPSGLHGAEITLRSMRRCWKFWDKWDAGWNRQGIRCEFPALGGCTGQAGCSPEPIRLLLPMLPRCWRRQCSVPTVRAASRT